MRRRALVTSWILTLAVSTATGAGESNRISPDLQAGKVPIIVDGQIADWQDYQSGKSLCVEREGAICSPAITMLLDEFAVYLAIGFAGDRLDEATKDHSVVISLGHNDGVLRVGGNDRGKVVFEGVFRYNESSFEHPGLWEALGVRGAFAQVGDRYQLELYIPKYLMTGSENLVTLGIPEANVQRADEFPQETVVREVGQKEFVLILHDEPKGRSIVDRTFVLDLQALGERGTERLPNLDLLRRRLKWNGQHEALIKLNSMALLTNNDEAVSRDLQFEIASSWSALGNYAASRATYQRFIRNAGFENTRWVSVATRLVQSVPTYADHVWPTLVKAEEFIDAGRLTDSAHMYKDIFDHIDEAGNGRKMDKLTLLLRRHGVLEEVHTEYRALR